MGIISTKEFVLSDFQKTLFPLDTSKILIENYSDEISTFIYNKISKAKESEFAFIPQIKTYA